MVLLKKIKLILSKTQIALEIYNTRFGVLDPVMCVVYSGVCIVNNCIIFC